MATVDPYPPELREELQELRERAERERPLRRGLRPILVPGSLWLLAAAVFLLAFWADSHGHLIPERLKPEQLGHIVQAQGTVRHVTHDQSWNRLANGKAILVPLRSGDLLQSGEEGRARLLFFGGNTLELEPGSIARIEDDGERVSIRLVLGGARLSFQNRLIAGKQWQLRGGDGKLSAVAGDGGLQGRLDAYMGGANRSPAWQ